MERARCAPERVTVMSTVILGESLHLHCPLTVSWILLLLRVWSLDQKSYITRQLARQATSRALHRPTRLKCAFSPNLLVFRILAEIWGEKSPVRPIQKMILKVLTLLLLELKTETKMILGNITW